MVAAWDGRKAAAEAKDEDHEEVGEKGGKIGRVGGGGERGWFNPSYELLNTRSCSVGFIVGSIRGESPRW